MRWTDPRLFVSLLAIGLFAWAYGENPGDQTLIGAIMGAGNMAFGYWLGSSSGSAIKTNLLNKED